jgi:uncharacterized membrane protein YeaQ/YmgE (transglycosylase-associated protein family)
MTFLWMVIIGSIVGAVSKALMHGRDAARLIALGIAGSLIAGGIRYAENEPVDLALSLMGSVTLLTLYRLTATTRYIERTSEAHDLRRAA